MKYEVKFYTYWHCSSGLSAGAKSDATVVKDGRNLPYIPGRTIKGHLREMAESLYVDEDRTFIDECFGTEDDKHSVCFFSDAVVDDTIKREHTQFLYSEIASTKLGENGIAEDGSLREIEVVVPLILYAEIKNCPDRHKDKMKEVLKMVKRVGLNRHRGLGRCDIAYVGGVA